MTVSQYARKAMLDWVFGGAAVSRPSSTKWVVWDSSLPTSVGANSPFGTRVALSYATATASAHSVANAVAITYASTAAGTVTISGIAVYDSSAAGNLLWASSNAGVVSVRSGLDSIVAAIGSIKCTLA